MTTYFFNGCRVQSEVTLPCDVAFASVNEEPRSLVTVRYGGKFPPVFSQVHWSAQRSWARAYDVGEGLLLSVMSDFHMLVAVDGGTITLFYDAANALAGALAGACTVNLGMAACALLRGELALHAASAQIDGQLIGVMAPSGTGKSTLLWSLLDHGALLFADDMTILRDTISDETPLAYPSAGLHAKLCREALERRNLNVEELLPVYPDSDEYWIPMKAHQRLALPYPLTALFVLRPAAHLATVGHIHVERAIGGRVLSLLNENMQGLWFALSRLDGQRYTRACIQLSQRVPIYVVQYHRCYQVLPTLVETIRKLATPPK